MTTHEQERVLMRLLSCFPNVSKEQLLGTSRKRDFSKVRHLIAYYLRVERKWELTKIAEILGGMHHTSIMHAVTTIAEQIEIYQDIEKDLQKMRDALASPPIQTQNGGTYQKQGWEVSTTC